MGAVRYRAIDVTGQADVAPITIAEGVEVLKTHSYNRRFIVIQNIINFRLSERFGAHYCEVASSAKTSAWGRLGSRLPLAGIYRNGLRLSLKHARNSWRYYYFALVRIGNRFVSETIKPYVGIVL